MPRIKQLICSAIYCNCIAKASSSCWERGVEIHDSVGFSSAAICGGGKPKSAKRVATTARGHRAPFGCGQTGCVCLSVSLCVCVCVATT